MTQYPSKQPNEIISEESIELLRHYGYIIVDKGAIGRAQREATIEANEEADKWRNIAFKRGELLDAIGRDVWEPVAEKLAA